MATNISPGPQFFEDNQTPVVLLPHAPHLGERNEFQPFDKDSPLPAFCDYWMPFRLDESWQSVPDKKSQFFYSGYPGLDTEWFDWLRSRQKKKLPTENTTHHRILYITRKFLDRDSPPPSAREVTQTWEEFNQYLDVICSSLEGSGREFLLIVKPHPQCDFRAVERLLAARPGLNWKISDESIYDTSLDCDLVIAPYSTAVIIPAALGVPVILIHSEALDEVRRWDQEKYEIYTKLKFYAKSLDHLAAKVFQVLSDMEAEHQSPDIEHIRFYWPDGAAERCFNRVMQINPHKSTLEQVK